MRSFFILFMTKNFLIKAKLYAAFIHAIVTLCVAAISAILIFFIWYPDGFARYVGGIGLYLIILGVEVCLGPLMSLVVFDSRKSKREIFFDYAIIGVIQLSGLLYGMHSTFISRPVYSVFVVDRLELISALELKGSDLEEAAGTGYEHLPLFGVRRVCINIPQDPQIRSDLLLSALRGKDIELMPKYYRECRQEEHLVAAHEGEILLKIAKEKNNADVAHELEKIGDFTWLPIKSRFGNWVEVYPGANRSEPLFLNIDPYHSM